MCDLNIPLNQQHWNKYGKITSLASHNLNLQLFHIISKLCSLLELGFLLDYTFSHKFLKQYNKTKQVQKIWTPAILSFRCPLQFFWAFSAITNWADDYVCEQKSSSCQQINVTD